MIIETGLKCVVSGSFEKFKSEIDRTIEEFRDLGIQVLAPDTGWILKPKYQILTPTHSNFRPLPAERGMSVRQVEDSFLSALRNSDFQYVEDPGGYVGDVAALEIGFALACEVLIFSRQPISPTLNFDPMWRERVSKIEPLEPAKVVEKVISSKAK